MRKATILKLVNHLNKVINENISMNAYLKKEGLPSNYFFKKKKTVIQDKESENISDDDYNEIMSLFKTINSRKISKNNKVIYSDEKTDDKSEVNIERNDNGKIVKYNFISYIKNKDSLRGSFTRDEMNLVYRLYSNYGSSITQREVSRFFPEYSLTDFKRILRAFNITKASAPFAPHMFEEYSKEDLLSIQFREKENDFLRTYEAEKIKFTEIQLKKYMKENQDLKEHISGIEETLKELDFSELPKCNIISQPSKSDKDLIIWLSDMHIGASVSDMSIYCNKYDEEEVRRRMDIILEDIKNFEYGFRSVIVCNLGDSLDGYNAQTTRGGHSLPQNMNNKEQFKSFLNCMVYFMSSLNSIIGSPIQYYCVGESNHDGDFGYAVNIALSYILEKMNIKTKVFDKFIGEFTTNNTTFVLCHGKDSKDMYKNLPLTLDIKTENFINEYLDSKHISGNIVFVKGDLHQSATTYGRRFTYKSVSSLFGSSEWIHKNFGNTPWGCDYSVVDNKGRMLDRLVRE